MNVWCPYYDDTKVQIQPMTSSSEFLEW